MQSNWSNLDMNEFKNPNDVSCGNQQLKVEFIMLIFQVHSAADGELFKIIHIIRNISNYKKFQKDQ